MTVKSGHFLSQTIVGSLCGYDLIAHAVADILADEYKTLQPLALKDVTQNNNLSPDILILDDAAIPTDDFEKILSELMNHFPDTQFICR